MKSLAVKCEEKRLRKWFDDFHAEDKKNDVMFCDWPYNSILNDKQIKLVFDKHYTNRYRRKLKRKWKIRGIYIDET